MNKKEGSVATGKTSPFKIRNIRLFIAFRVFFNSRFYYPVFTILFLDFGLTLDQFAILNLVWALTIVLLEIPSGALADTVGRKNLLVFAGVCMVLEMALLCFAPLGNPEVLFYIFLCNRVLSGSAEAAASGADEALAYDSLKDEGDPKDWGKVLVRQMGFRSMGFVFAMSIGAAVYDPALLKRLADWLGLNISLNQNITLRFPLYLTLATAIITLLITLAMKSMKPHDTPEVVPLQSAGESIINTMKVTMAAGKWIVKTPFALVIIATGMIFDHIIRMTITLNSQYYRLIDLPESVFGLIGSGLALLGLFIPRIAMKLAENHSPAFNMGVMAVVTLAGFWGVTLFLPVFGIIPLAMLSSVMYFTGFFVSHYLNRITDSSRRATVLSFKGLSFNLAYGFICLLYAMLLNMLRSRDSITAVPMAGERLENTVFIQSFGWFPWYFAVTFAALLIFSAWQLRHSEEHRNRG
jgi:MFS family permease